MTLCPHSDLTSQKNYPTNLQSTHTKQLIYTKCGTRVNRCETCTMYST